MSLNRADLPEIGQRLRALRGGRGLSMRGLAAHKGDTLGMVLAGELTLEADGRGAFNAGAGDAFYVKAGTLHGPIDHGDETVKLVAVRLRK